MWREMMDEGEWGLMGVVMVIAWTEDDGQTWTKLNFGQGGNPVIYSWPEKNLSELALG
jgi:hypothetical protein